LAFGEGWHNNHHAHPSTARAGHQWWEIDMTFWVIRGLQFVGLASDVNDHIPLGEKHEAPADV
jgi:stearoyl-CoA desaturase (delta-9 desaturase)